MSASATALASKALYPWSEPLDQVPYCSPELDSNGGVKFAFYFSFHQSELPAFDANGQTYSLRVVDASGNVVDSIRKRVKIVVDDHDYGPCSTGSCVQISSLEELPPDLTPVPLPDASTPDASIPDASTDARADGH
jgi:hypothetical protein